MSLMSEFREFAMKGNVVDLAVGVIIGAAFGKIVESMVGNVLMPVIGLLGGAPDFKTLAAGPIKYGLFVQTGRARTERGLPQRNPRRAREEITHSTYLDSHCRQGVTASHRDLVTPRHGGAGGPHKSRPYRRRSRRHPIQGSGRETCADRRRA